MKRNQNVVNIDPDKLRAECKKRGLHYTEVSRECGYSNKLLDNAFISGRIKTHVVKMLDMMYNIKPETYVLTQDEPVQGENNPEKSESVDSDAYWNRLYEVTYEAVYNAFKKAMND